MRMLIHYLIQNSCTTWNSIDLPVSIFTPSNLESLKRCYSEIPEAKLWNHAYKPRSANCSDKLISQDWGWSFLNAIPDDEEHEYHQHSYLLLHSEASYHNSERLHLLEFKSDARCVFKPLVTVPQLELHNGGHSWRPQISGWTSNFHYWHCW